MMAGRVRIGEMKVTDAFGNLLREIPLGQLEPINQIKSINTRDDGIEIVVTENANDPQIALPLKEALNFEGKLPFPVGQWFPGDHDRVWFIHSICHCHCLGLEEKMGQPIS